MEIGKQYTYLGFGDGKDFKRREHGDKLSTFYINLDDEIILSGSNNYGALQSQPYFKEAPSQTPPEPTLKDAYLKMQSECGIEAGDTVKVVRKVSDGEMGWGSIWSPYMNTLIGQQFQVVKNKGVHGFLLKNNVFPFFCLELVKKGTTPIKLNDDYSAEISSDGETVKVGCQDIPAEAVLTLATHIKEVRRAN